MKDYTDQLKKYWKTNELSFIATLKKNVDDKFGFFTHFVNPVSKLQLFYPSVDDIQIEDKRVSLYYKNVQELVDGEYYKVELEFNSKAIAKNNPYLLQIKSVGKIDQEKVKEVLQTENNTPFFYGEYQKVSDTFCCFKNVMFKDSGDILMFNGEAQQVFVSPNLNLKENTFYTFQIKVNEGKLPNAIPTSITEIKIDPYQEYIRLRFERLNNPEANKMIANLMREIGKGMYSSKQRMIFELLQNADDAPGKEKVEFHIDINGEYFFVMHDGAPFNKDDVEAITSAAESTKINQNKKTGYKGIGFKSVFTDSTEVWIKSGGYQFAFIRNSELFDNFDRFYFSSERYKKYPELIDEDQAKYRNQRLRFNGATDIPWQVIPIWQDDLPREFKLSNFNNFNNPVQFALRLGETNIEDYKIAIDNITNRPQFILFLRNTSKFRSPKNGVTVFRQDKNSIIEITKTKRDEKSKNYTYLKQTYEDIEVSEEAFASQGIGLKKQSRINDYNEVSYFFTDLSGKEIETIPPKLASVDETELSFAILVVNGKIIPEKEYLKSLPKYSSLFTYLPMEDTRFQLPFLVNADFVPSSDRQKIQGDNLWNKYIMVKVAEKHVEMLSFFGDKFIDGNKNYSTYLSLLLKEQISEDDTAQQIINSYNEKYLEKLLNTPIIVNDRNEMQLLTDTIIDNSGFTKLFGNELFYKILDTKKLLPHLELDVKLLKEARYLQENNRLNLEIIDLEELSKKITPSFCEELGRVIAEKELYKNDELIAWLDKLVVHLPNDFGKIPFIVHNDVLFSLDTLLAEEFAWIINQNMIDCKEFLSDLGYNLIDLKLEKYKEINNYLNTIQGYLNLNTLAFDRLAQNPNLSKLKPQTKVNIIKFFKTSRFMTGIGENKYYCEMRIFVDETGLAKPLQNLLNRPNLLVITSLKKFRIKEDEFNVLPESFKSKLIDPKDIFIDFCLNEELFTNWSSQFDSSTISNYVEDLTTIFGWKPEADEILQSQWAAIKWIYIDDEMRFVDSNKVYWSNAFSKLDLESFEIIKNLFQTNELKLLPNKKCGELISIFNLKNDSQNIENWNLLGELDTITANILLDWMEQDGKYFDFFNNYTLKAEGNKWKIQEIENHQIFDGSELELKKYIDSNENLKFKFLELNKVLCSDKRYKIGLIQGEKLIFAIIETKQFDQKLTNYLPQQPEWKIIEALITNLENFKLNTEFEYDATSPEHILLHQIIKKADSTDEISEDFKKLIENFRLKITINDQSISDFDLSDLIQFGNDQDKKTLKLSDVLPDFKGESDILDNIIDSFIAIKNKSKLRKLIFKTRKISYEEIANRIEENELEYYTVHQVIFQHLIETQKLNFNWKKGNDFWSFFKDNNIEAIKNELVFLEEIYKLNIFDIFYYAEKYVEEKWALPEEIAPTWMLDWLKSDYENKYEFLTKLGYNGTNSPIVKLRQSTLKENYNELEVFRYYEEAKKSNLIYNTIVWLSNFSSEIITRNIKLIEQINLLSKFNDDDAEKKYLPTIVAVDKDDNRTYSIQLLEKNQELLFLNKNQDYVFSIFNTLKLELNNSVIVDESSGNLINYFSNKTNIELEVYIDYKELSDKSILWDESFYVKWEFYKKYPIFIFDGSEIPFIRTFNDITINHFTFDLKIEDDGEFYISKVLKSDILNNLPESFPKDKLQHLKDWHYRTLQDPTLLDEDTFEYKENIDRLIQDRLGITFEDQKKESGNAKTHAVYFLDELGYNVSMVENGGASLLNIIDPDGKTIECIVRSAKGGLLYLDKSHWQMLGKKNTYMVVIYPGNSPRLFKDREELLSEELSKNVLFRFKNSKEASDYDEIFNLLKSNSNMILVTSEKMRESLFSKLKNKKSLQTEHDSAIADDDFEID
jgi:hypothetical protein